MYYKILSALAVGLFIGLTAPIAKQADNFNKCVEDGNKNGLVVRGFRLDEHHEVVSYCNGAGQ